MIFIDDLGNPDRHHAAELLCDSSYLGCIFDCISGDDDYMGCISDCDPPDPLPCDECVIDGPNCQTCHTLSCDGDSLVVPGTDCLVCHGSSTIEGSPGSSNRHHLTDLYYARDCDACHNP